MAMDGLMDGWKDRRIVDVSLLSRARGRAERGKQVVGRLMSSVHFGSFLMNTRVSVAGYDDGGLPVGKKPKPKWSK